MHYLNRLHAGMASGLILIWAAAAWANSGPVVSNVTASQRGDASKLVDIHYDLADTDGDPCTIWVALSDDAGASWRVPARSFTGDIGQTVTPGTGKAVVWDAGADMPGRVGNFRVRVFVDDGNGPGAQVLVPAGWFPYQNVTNPTQWVYVDTFLIDNYEVTNAFYCQFLNNADPTAAHWYSGMQINRWGDAGNHTYTVQAGKENYPVFYVNRYDAEAFAAWRSAQEGATYRLPTEQEWEKAAAWDPTQNRYYLYGFHQDTISCPWCNYYNGSSYCVGATTPVGHYDGTNGTNDARSYYGCYDLSGNLFEWTSEASGVRRGGSWVHDAAFCQCTYRDAYSPGTRGSYSGFRLVLDPY